MFSPKLAAEVTLQPIRRFGFDAAILFSDILVIPHALGRSVRFAAGEGPRLEPLDDPAAIAALRGTIDDAMLTPITETIRLVKAELPPAVTFLGFVGSWTVATYMVAGHGTPDQAPARLFAYRHPEAFARLIDILVEASSNYLIRPAHRRCRRCANLRYLGRNSCRRTNFSAGALRPTQRIVADVRRAVPGAKIIGFPRGRRQQLETLRRGYRNRCRWSGLDG